MSIQQRIRRFVLENFYVADPSELADDTSLVGTGLVDSTGILEVLAFLEAEFGIRIEDRETTPDNLETIERMVAFVVRKQRERDAEGGLVRSA
jgi:acyl carrier protein